MYELAERALYNVTSHSNSKMSFKLMEEASIAVLEKYRLRLLADMEFQTEEFRAELDIATGCKNLKQSDEALTHLWHETKDLVLLYFFDNLDPKRVEYQFFIARAYGLKSYDDPHIHEARDRFWSKNYAHTELKPETSDEPFESRTVLGKRIIHVPKAKSPASSYPHTEPRK